jgi:hypothetical protein
MPPPVSRRTFLCRTAAAAALAVAPPFLAHDSATAQGVGQGAIAAFIGKGLASGVVGAVGSMAFGQIMQAMGFDLNGQAAMAAKLDLIIAKLEQLQNTIDALQVYLEKQLSVLKYDVAYERVAPLIGTNKTIIRLMQTMLEIDPKAHPVQVFDLKSKINALVRTTEYQNGLATWHDALIGGNGQTSLLGAWGSVVFNQDPHFFNTAQAAKIQDRWDSFDAQQGDHSLVPRRRLQRRPGAPARACNEDAARMVGEPQCPARRPARLDRQRRYLR